MLKIVLVDDELLELRMLENLLYQMNNDIEIKSFSSSSEAYAFIKTAEVDLLITDVRMSRMSGLELIGRLYEDNISLETIILSGFAEFEYVKEAMKYGVKHYLLKPVDLDELKAVMEETKKLIYSKKSYSDYDKNEKRIEFLENVCIGAFDSEIDQIRSFEEAEFPFSLENSGGFVLSIKIQDTNERDNEEYEKSFLNIFVDYFKKNVYDIYNKNDTFMYLIFGEKNAEAYEIENLIYELAGIKIKAEIPVEFDNILSFDKKDLFSTEDKLELFVSRIVSNDKSISKQLVKLIVDECINSGIDSKEVKKNVIYGIISDEKLRIVHEFNKKVGFELEENSDDIIDITERYIEKNYKRSITREEIANVVNMNPSYFSRYFKKRKNISFHEYLAKFRVDKAKEMLLTDKSMEQITTDVGFFNLRTFRRNFYVFTGMTPMDYRKKYRGG